MPPIPDTNETAAAEAEHMDLPFDGERYIPGMGGRIAAEHLARYAFAAQFVRGKKVLDIASGEGYGTAIMAQNAKSIIGMDVAENAIAYAKRKYSSVSNARFELGDITALPFDANTFDVIVCYETVEHVDDPVAAITELQRVLKDNGVLIVSTPNKENYSVRFDYSNPYHKKELGFLEFQSALGNAFEYTKLFGQFSGGSSHIFDIDDQGQWPMPENDFEMTYADVTKWTGKGDTVSAAPMYFLAVCSAKVITSRIRPFGFFDASDWQVIEDEFLLRKTQDDLKARNVLLEAANQALEAANQALEGHKHDIGLLQSSLDGAQNENQKLSSALETSRIENKLKADRINRLTSALDSSREQLQAVLSSTTWRLTTGLRNIINKSKILRRVARYLGALVAPRR